MTTIVPSDTDLNTLFEVTGEILSTGNNSPVNGPTGVVNPRWALSTIHWNQGGDIDNGGIQRFTDYNGFYIRKYADDAGIITFRPWIKVTVF